MLALHALTPWGWPHLAVSPSPVFDVLGPIALKDEVKPDENFGVVAEHGVSHSSECWAVVSQFCAFCDSADYNPLF